MKRPETPLVAPSVLGANFSKLDREISKIDASGSDWVHLDVMDGHFVPNLTFGPKLIQDLRPLTSRFFDVHLMVERPGDLVDEYLKAGSEAITFHWEAEVHHHRLLTKIKDAGALTGIAFVPSTPVEALAEVLPWVDIVLVMTINPGFGGQKYLPSCTEKIKKLDHIRKEKGYSYVISIDGGVNSTTYLEPLGAGADILVTGSAFFDAPDPAEYVRLLKSYRRS